MNPYGVKVDDENLYRPLISLQVLYDGMPTTSGCEKCQEANGDDAWWCCREISPSMYYVEFLKVWEHVQESWSKKKKTDLVIRAIKNYLSSESKKGCIFWGQGCACYPVRPFYCRLYGVIPVDSWDKKIASIKEREDGSEVRSQCLLVSSSKPISEKDEDKWFEHIKQTEEEMGMPKHCIALHDLPGGCYRTFHDHLLLELLEASALNKLTQIKLTKPSAEHISLFAEELAKQIEKTEEKK